MHIFKHISALDYTCTRSTFFSILPESVHWPLEYWTMFFKVHAVSQACLLHFGLWIQDGDGEVGSLLALTYEQRLHYKKQEPSALPRGLVSQCYMPRGWNRCPGVSVSPQFLHSLVLMKAQMVRSVHVGSVGAQWRVSHTMREAVRWKRGHEKQYHNWFHSAEKEKWMCKLPHNSYWQSTFQSFRNHFISIFEFFENL